jgi:hypothetical protein
MMYNRNLKKVIQKSKIMIKQVKLLKFRVKLKKMMSRKYQPLKCKRFNLQLKFKRKFNNQCRNHKWHNRLQLQSLHQCPPLIQWQCKWISCNNLSYKCNKRCKNRCKKIWPNRWKLLQPISRINSKRWKLNFNKIVRSKTNKILFNLLKLLKLLKIIMFQCLVHNLNKFKHNIKIVMLNNLMLMHYLNSSKIKKSKITWMIIKQQFKKHTKKDKVESIEIENIRNQDHKIVQVKKWLLNNKEWTEVILNPDLKQLTLTPTRKVRDMLKLIQTVDQSKSIRKTDRQFKWEVTRDTVELNLIWTNKILKEEKLNSDFGY